MISKPWLEIPDKADVKVRLERGKKRIKDDKIR